MTERQQPGVAEQKIEAERGDGGNQAIGQELRLVEADMKRQQRQHDKDDSGGHKQHELGTIRDAADVGCHHATCRIAQGRNGKMECRDQGG